MPSSPLKTESQYRPAIDGLRAVAVLAVFVFHLNNAWLRGGFVGVDIFFAISGYLITSILVRDYGQGDFNLAKFYQRRIARLLPVFFAVALATIAGATLVYMPRDLASCGVTLAATAMSVANLKFMLLGTYFKISPDAQPFLHFWTLSVEEQFYMLFPVVLWLLYSKASRYRTPILASLFTASLIACVILTRARPVWAFFSLPTRAWELLAGSLLALFCSKGDTERPPLWDWLSLSGLGLIGASLFLINDGSNFPGYLALFPVLGTILVIGPAGGSNGLAERLLSWRPMTLIGRISYSLYLWHWPIFSLVDYRLYLSSPATRISLKVALSLAASILSFLLIETPGRTFLNRPGNRRIAFGFLACFLGVLVPLGALVYHENYYINPDLRDVARGGVVFNADSSKGSLVLMGDSNGSMYSRMMRQLADKFGYKLTCISVADADPLPNNAGTSSGLWPDDSALWADSLNIVKSAKPDYVLLVCCWTQKLATDQGRLSRAVAALKGQARHIILITQPPELPPSANREAMRNGSRPPFWEDAAERKARDKANRVVRDCVGPGVTVIDIEHYFETRDGEIIFWDGSGRWYYNDEGHHLSDYGADLVKADVQKLIETGLSNTANNSLQL
jgi:peptidoglycan/LPS O-acetylase OafA/YrhL